MSRLHPSYAVDDGDLTVVGRHQQVVVAAWVLGFMAGPLPALIALLVRPGRGLYHRLLVAAVWFWTAVVLVGLASVWLAAATGSLWFMVGWMSAAVAGVIVTGIVIVVALRRI